MRRFGAFLIRLATLDGRLRRGLAGAIVGLLAISLIGTVFGAGALGQKPDVFDGSAWLWSRLVGDAGRVNAMSGAVDLHQPLVEAKGHRLRITQSDQYLILQDLETGKITSIDLTRMGFSGSLELGMQNDTVLLLAPTGAVVVDRTRGLVRGVDPATLQPRGETLQLPAPLVGGAFDNAGMLWVGLPQQGTVVGITVGSTGTPTIARTESVAKPASDLAISVLDDGVLAVDRGGDRLVAVSGGKIQRMTSPVRLAGAQAPARTVGPLAAVSVPGVRTVVTIRDVTAPTRGGKPNATPWKAGPVGTIPMPKGVDTAVALPFAGRVYIADSDANAVHVYDAQGKRIGTIKLSAANGPIELEVREQHLFINAVDASVASVVSEDGKSRTVEKYDPAPATSTGAPVTDSPKPAPTTKEAKPTKPTKPTQTPTRTSPVKPTTAGPDPTDPGPKPGPTASSKPDPTPPVPPEEEPPGAPVPVTALPGDGKVSLSWGRSAPGGAPVTGYTITWTDGGSAQAGADTLGLEVTGLTNGKEYTFRVVAANRYGNGPPAVSQEVKPVAEKPDRPGRPTATAEDNGVVRVTWPAVANAQRYVITPLKDGKAGDNPPQEITGTEAEFAALSLGAPYTFTVVAAGATGGASDPSEPSNEVVPYDVPGKPVNVKAVEVSAGHYEITWEAPAANGKEITGYSVCDKDGKTLEEFDSKATGGTVTAAAGMTTLRVAAVNEAGEGEAVVVEVQLPKPTVTIGAVTTGTDTLSAKLTVNDQGYDATCKTTLSPGGDSSTSCSTASFTGLEPGTTYTIKATVTTDAGTAEDTKTAKTDEDDSGTLTGTVTCSGGPDPNVCADGIGYYTDATTSSTLKGHAAVGATVSIPCHREGEMQKGQDYGGQNTTLWLGMSNGYFIPWAWVRLNNGNEPSVLSPCD